MIQYYEKDIMVSQYECDFRNRMKIGAMLRQVEQISMDNCTAIGINTDLYERTKTAFLMMKLSMVCHRDITVGESLKLITTPALPIRAVYNRYTSLNDMRGNELIGIDTRWVLVNTQTHRILRKPPEEFDLPFLEKSPKENDFTLKKAEAFHKTGEEYACYSRVDCNRHLNNAEYADIICNHLPMKLLEKKSVKRLVLTYQNELTAGDTMKLYCGTLTEAEQYYWKGERSDGRTCFEANIELG